MSLSGLNNADLKLILFGGKGGVGKTSCATATALELAKKHRTLLISTDPAHSVSDSLDQPIGYKQQQVCGVDNLTAIEISADEAFAAFKQEHEAELKKLFDTSTNLDNEDIDQLMDLSIPGIDEVMSFKTIIDFIEEGKFEKYVVDTAPTGHALRLLSSPKLLDEWIKTAARLRWKYRYMITSFSGSYQPDDTDTMLLNLKKTVKRIEELLSDKKRCEFIPVCIPESMAVNETIRLLADLEKYKITIRQMVINNVMETGTCDFCRQKKMGQQKYIGQIYEMYGKSYNVVKMPMYPLEIKGLETLEIMRKQLFDSNIIN
jgi:arsenite/tail-anchored protein-transporting ATPase